MGRWGKGVERFKPDLPKPKKGNPNLVKGVSGNPGGRPKIDGVIRELAAKKTPDAFMRIVALGMLADDPEADNRMLAIALAANQYIVDRACGRPAQAVNLGDQDGGPLQITVTIREKDGPRS